MKSAHDYSKESPHMSRKLESIVETLFSPSNSTDCVLFSYTDKDFYLPPEVRLFIQYYIYNCALLAPRGEVDKTSVNPLHALQCKIDFIHTFFKFFFSFFIRGVTLNYPPHFININLTVKNILSLI